MCTAASGGLCTALFVANSGLTAWDSWQDGDSAPEIALEVALAVLPQAIGPKTGLGRWLDGVPNDVARKGADDWAVTGPLQGVFAAASISLGWVEVRSC